MSTCSATICNCPSTRVQRKFSRSLLPSFHPSISASAAPTKEPATQDGSFLAIGLLTLFESTCPSAYRHYHLSCLFHSIYNEFLLVLLFHSPTPFLILFLPHLTPTEHRTQPFSWAGRALVFTRFDWNGSLRSLRIWRYSLKCAESLTL